MAIPTRVIKRRIKSIRSTRKIMKAMELVAGSKMRKTTQLALGTRPYTDSLETLLKEVRTRIHNPRHPLLVGHPLKQGKKCSTLIIVASSDRGLCGGFNSQILKKLGELTQARAQDTIEVVSVGRRAEQGVRRLHQTLSASFEAISSAPSFERAAPVARLAYEGFIKKRYDRVFVVFTQFKSALVQIPLHAQLLPMTPEAELPKETPEEWDSFYKKRAPKPDFEPEGLFEPSSDGVLQELLPRLLEIQIYRALLESSASEHSARMMAMKSAGDAAKEMLGDLTLTLNQARQSAITQEISEISAGKAAIE